LIYLASLDRAGVIQSLKVIIPKYIWNITNYTFAAGIIVLILGIVFINWKQLRNQVNQIKELNEEYKNENRQG